MSRKYYTVDLCVGDEHGAFTGRVEAVDVYEHHDGASESLIELRPHIYDETAEEWIGLPFEYNRRGDCRVVSVTIGAETFRITGGPGSGGNWSWESVSMPLNEVCRLLNHLKAARHTWTNGESCHLFDIEQGTEKFWEWWKDAGLRFRAVARAPLWFRALSRKRRRKLNRQSKRTRCLVYKLAT